MPELSKASTEDRKCENCGRPFHHGRSDRRFCNDSCRNNYNRKKTAEKLIADHENLPEIFKIIKRNYEILKKHASYDEENIVWFKNKQELIDEGYNFKFFTSIFNEPSGFTYHCCFDLGCCDNEDNEAFIKYVPEQAKIS